MPLNGFVTGRKLWVEIKSNSVRIDFIGRLLYLTEKEGENYHLQFRDGPSLSFNKADLDTGTVACHEVPTTREET